MKQILFIHPDPTLTKLYQSHLSPHFNVDSASDGLTAWRKMRLSAPVAIVSEYHLPVLSGAALLRQIRSHPKLSFVPFIFLTDHTDASLALSLGANDWLVRHQTTPLDLIEKIHGHLKTNQLYAL